MRTTLRTAIVIAFAAAAGAAFAGPLDKTECIAPAKPGGGFDLTCKLAQSALADAKLIADSIKVVFGAGGTVGNQE